MLRKSLYGLSIIVTGGEGMKRIALLILSMLALAINAQAGGYQIPEQGAKAAGLANALPVWRMTLRHCGLIPLAWPFRIAPPSWLALM
jgi:hypothetical protein